MASALDAEGSDRYTFDQDYKFAINFSIEWLVAAFNQAFSDSKLSPECLRELNKTRIWQANAFSRVAFDPAVVGDKLWSLIAVYPLPVVTPFSNPVTINNPNQSEFKPALAYVSCKNSCKRLTQEEWNENVKNVFMPGNELLTGSLQEYAYLDFSDYSSTNYTNPVPQEITIRPSIAKKYVALAYIKFPNSVATVNDNVEFPESMTNLIVDKTLEFLSTKQGDQTNLFSLSDRDMNRLIGLMK